MEIKIVLTTDITIVPRSISNGIICLEYLEETTMKKKMKKKSRNNNSEMLEMIKF